MMPTCSSRQTVPRPRSPRHRAAEKWQATIWSAARPSCGTGPPTQRPLRLEAAILSRTRSPITSRSNWAKESSTLSVSRPMLDVVVQDGAVEVRVRESAVIVAIRNQAPALMRPALDIGLAGLALGIERVEFEIE